jgi:hypothetical protein
MAGQAGSRYSGLEMQDGWVVPHSAKGRLRIQCLRGGLLAAALYTVQNSEAGTLHRRQTETCGNVNGVRRRVSPLCHRDYETHVPP